MSNSAPPPLLASPVLQLKADVLGTQVWLKESTKKSNLAVEQHKGNRRKGCQMRRKSVLRAGAAGLARCGNLRGAPVADFREMAR